ncbi:MAG: hypothetical protein KGZ59_11060 [Chitinophagaceae bacterium]|nr:hypothetical protein [Chitinophagaceae bacterium]
MKANINIYSSIAITLLNSLTFFILYKIILLNLGIEQLGLWAIIIGFTSILSQSTAAVNTNIIREVAEADEFSFQSKAARLMMNGLVIYVAFFILLSIIVYVALAILFKENFLNYLTLISLNLFAIFINLLSTVFSSVLDARKLNYIKNLFIGLANILFLTVCFFTIKNYALIGVAIAQIFQAVFLLVCILFFVLRKIKISFNSKEIDKKNILLFFRDSWKLQGISLLVLCYEPITKFFLAKYGLTYVAKYEIANKIIAQLRNIFAVTNQTLLAYFVNKFTEGKIAFLNYYEKISSRNIEWSVISSGILIILSPIISLFFLKELDWYFIIIFLILLFSNLINIISITPYFNFFAQKQYQIPFISHIIIALLNIVFSITLGLLFSGTGVVVAWSVSLLIGSLYIIYQFNKKEQLDYVFINFSKHINLNFLLLLGSLAVLLLLHQFAFSIIYMMCVILIITTIYLFRAYKLFQLND